jgi:hypothetical protein
MMTAGQDFFTVDSLATMAVASAAIIAVTNTVRRVFGMTHLIIPFFVSLCVTWRCG